MNSATPARLMRLSLALALASIAPVVHALQFAPGTLLPVDVGPQYNREARSAAIGDLNADGRTDVLMLVRSSTLDPTQVQADHEIYVYEQQPDGRLLLALRQTYAPGNVLRYDPALAVLQDLNGDRVSELLLSTGDGVAVLRRNVQGRFDEAARIPSPIAVARLLTRDLDGDGAVELVVQNAGYATAVFKGLGGTAFAAPVYVMHYGRSNSDISTVGGTILADIDEDGAVDMLTAHVMQTQVAINRGQRNGYFGAPHIIDSTFLPSDYGMAIATARTKPTQSQPRLVMASTVTVRLSEHENRIDQLLRTFDLRVAGAPETGRTQYPLGIATATQTLRAADLDRDGDDDLILYRSGDVDLIETVEGGAFDTPVHLFPAQPVFGNFVPTNESAHVADFNSDGCLDIGLPAGGYLIYYQTGCAVSSRTRTEVPLQAAPRVTPRPLRGVKRLSRKLR